MTGTAAEIAAAATADNAGTLALAADFGATVDAGSVAATDLTTIVGQTSATINATAATAITGTASAVVAAINHVQVNHDDNFTVTLTADSTATAADLKTINTATSGIITATGVTAITGSISDINDVLAAETSQGNAGQQIDLDTDFTVTVSDTGSVAATTLTTLDS